jgi:hypothetical protein
MSTLRVNQVYLNDIGNTTISIANSWNVAVIAGGQTRLQVNNDGNIGIGTSSPSTKLDVVGTIRGNGNISTADGYVFGWGNFSSYVGGNSTANFVNVYVNSSERMRIDASGNVGIGTTSPVASMSVVKQTVALTGTSNPYGLYMYPTSSGLAYIDAVTSTSGTTSLGFRTYNNGTYTDGIRIDASGNTGIGTNSPTYKLDVAGQANVATISATRAYMNVSSATDAATINLNFNISNNFNVTLGGARTLSNPTNTSIGQAGIIFISQDATGGRTLAFGNNWRFPGNTAPTLSTSANAVDAIAYTVRASGSIVSQALLNVG